MSSKELGGFMETLLVLILMVKITGNTIRFAYGYKEKSPDHYIVENTESGSITIGYVGYQFILKFCGGRPFRKMMIEILCKGKRKQKF